MHLLYVFIYRVWSKQNKIIDEKRKNYIIVNFNY